MWWFRPFVQLDQIQNTLARIERKVDAMTQDIHALDEAIGTLTSDVATLKTAVEALIAAIPPGDFTAEIQAVQDAFASVEQTTAEAKGATPPA